MNNEYYNTNNAQIYTQSQLDRRGLLHGGVRLSNLGIYRIVDEVPEYDPDLQTLDAGSVQASEDGETVRRVFTATYREFETVKSVLRQRVKARRRRVEEESGTTLNGMAVETDRQSQSMLNGAVEYLRRNPDATIQWQLPDLTFMTLDAAKVNAPGRRCRCPRPGLLCPAGSNLRRP